MTLPLTNLRVLDLTHVYAGPTCTRVLADLGAEVIKIEGLRRVDVSRNFCFPGNDASGDYYNRAATFLYRNAGKKSLTLDFTNPEAVELFRRLVPHADIVAESFTPRVMAQHGLDYESLRALKDDIIVVSLSGYGQTGPWRDYTAYGMGLEPAAGISSLTGYPGGDPMRTGMSFTDPYVGLAGAAAVLTALHYRRSSGRGQFIDLAQQEAAIPIAGYAVMDAVLNRRRPQRNGNRSPWFAPQGCYPCRGDDNWLVITVRDDAEWQAFCDATGHPEWADDERFADVTGRFRHHDELDEIIASWTRGQDHIEAMHLLQQAGVIAAAVLDGREQLFDPHLREREAFQTVDQPGVGPVPAPRQLGARFSAFEAGPPAPAPRLGEHNRDVLQGLLGLSDEELARLEAEGAIGDAPKLAVPPELVRRILEWPLEDYVRMGVMRTLDPDFKQRLGLSTGGEGP